VCGHNKVSGESVCGHNKISGGSVCVGTIRYQVGTILTVIILLAQLVLSGTLVTIYTTCSAYLPTTVFMHFMFPE